jgi:hypothetical protein
VERMVAQRLRAPGAGRIVSPGGHARSQTQSSRWIGRGTSVGCMNATVGRGTFPSYGSGQAGSAGSTGSSVGLSMNANDMVERRRRVTLDVVPRQGIAGLRAGRASDPAATAPHDPASPGRRCPMSRFHLLPTPRSSPRPPRRQHVVLRLLQVHPARTDLAMQPQLIALLHRGVRPGLEPQVVG